VNEQAYREPLRVTLARTGTIAVVLGLAIAMLAGGGVRYWPAATLLALWPAFGGHWVELFFLNWLRPRLPADRRTHAIARILVWFAGGCALAAGVYLTAMALHGSHAPRMPAWWIGGLAFIGIELIVHLVLQLRGVNNFYNGRG